MASVALPGWKPEKKRSEKDPLDIIAQGLQIAQSAYGIYSDSEKLDMARKSQKQAQELTSAQLEETRAKTKKLAEAEPDAITQKELSGLYEKGWTPGEGPKAQQFAMRGGKTIGLIPPQAKPEKVDYRDVTVYDPQQKENVVISVAKNQPVPKGFLAPRKEEGAPKTFEVAGVGAVKDEKTAKDLSDSMERYSNLKAGIAKMLDVRSQAGIGGFEVMNRELVKTGTQTAQDVKFQYKDLAKLGVLSDQDAIALANIVPDDPTAWGGSVNKQIVELGKLTDVKMANGLYQKGIKPEKIVAITGELPTLITQGMSPAQQIALKELLIEQNQMGSR